ncbi:hypothetical protein GQ44DRAFT_732679 [Phaeosphaeriaceae sp. PMI808]|nr:hypothetical protein GQ44DRAFT_732679 [Phaeosphaeriaceae sp. PMI808]
MEPEPLPDHYKALGVDPKAEVTAIKAAHRKLVLTCHPDKVKDPELKQQKQEEFHCIQRAYEVLSDEKERGRYDAEITLAAIRKNKLSSSSSSRAKSTRFDTRPTNSGSSPQYATEEFRPSGSYDDDKYHDDRDRDRARGSTRHKYDASSRGSYDTYDAYPKSGSSPRADKDSRSAKASSDRTRSHQTKTRDKEERRDRSERSRFAHVEGESSSDEKARHEAGYKRRSQEDEAQRQAADARRKAEERRSYEDGRYNTDPRARKLSTQEEEARLYQHKSRAQVEAEIRPSPARNSSRDYYGETSNHSSRRESRPEAVRRSSAQPKDRRGSSGRERDRGIPEIVEWNNDDTSRRPPPPLKQYNSSPPTIEVSRTTPNAHTQPNHHHTLTTPPPPPQPSSAPKLCPCPRPSTPLHPAPRPAPPLSAKQ